jgi:hypothetical protein
LCKICGIILLPFKQPWQHFPKNSPPPKSISLQVKKAIELSQWNRPLYTSIFLHLDGSWQKGIAQQPKPGIWLWDIWIFACDWEVAISIFFNCNPLAIYYSAMAGD